MGLFGPSTREIELERELEKLKKEIRELKDENASLASRNRAIENEMESSKMGGGKK